jgi:archaellin
VDLPSGFWMGMAVGDFYNTGYQSMFFTNSGDTINMFMMKMRGADPAKIPQNFTSNHIMVKNKGDYKFEIVKDNGINGNKTTRAGLGWGAISMDFALDGNQSIVYSNNWKNILWQQFRLLRDNGTVLQNLGDGTFKRRSYFKNPHFSMTPIAIDLTGNGVKDLVWINNNYYMIGYLNNHGVDNNWFNIALPKTSEFANVMILVEDSSGRIQSQQNIMGGTGLCSSKSSTFQFGFGKETPVVVKIRKALGAPTVIHTPKLFETFYILA